MFEQCSFTGKQLQNHNRCQRLREDALVQSNEAEINRHRNWSHEEILKLTIFLKEHQNAFADYKAKRAVKIYKSLSMFMKSRNANQCRTYMQKMIRKFGNVENALVFLSQVALSYQDHSHHREKQQISSQAVKEQPTQQQQVREEKIQNEQDDKELVATGTQYIEQQVILAPAKSRKSLWEDDHFSRMSEFYLGQMGSYASNSKIEGFIHDQNYPFFSIKKIDRLESSNDKENTEILWTDCHQTFIKWVDSLRKLLEKRRNKDSLS